MSFENEDKKNFSVSITEKTAPDRNVGKGIIKDKKNILCQPWDSTWAVSILFCYGHEPGGSELLKVTTYH